MDGVDYTEKTLSMVGYSSITITYARNTSGLASSDAFVSEWYNGSSWSTIENIASGFSGWTLVSDLELPVGAANNPNFKIRFRAATAAGRYFYVDSVTVKGSTGCISDTIPPASPTGLTASGGYEQISLNWDNSTETDLNHYNLYRSLASGGSLVRIGGDIQFSDYADDSLGDRVTFYYVVTAVDHSGNESAISTQAVATTCMTMADFNCDGIVDTSDLDYMAGVWLTSDTKADIAEPANQMVNLEDLVVLAQQWLR
jgi:predicted phage tail protein